MWRAMRAVCGDCLVTIVVRTITAITSTVSRGATVTFPRRDTTPRRSLVKMTRRTALERVRLEEIFNKNKLENRSGVRKRPHLLI